MGLVWSPLRYPGGKVNLAQYVNRILTLNDMSGTEFVEPFAGGAGVTLSLLQWGTISSAVLVERDPLVYAFWESVFFHADDLCELIESTDITIDTWNQREHYRHIDVPVEPLIVDLGFSALFYSRTNFSGILNAGPIGGQRQTGKYKIDCRFKKDRLIRDILFLYQYRDRVQVVFADGLSFISTHSRTWANKNTFVYVDPPYYIKGRSLYRHFFSDEQHIRLAHELKSAHFPWLLSYDNCTFVNSLYSNNEDRFKFRHLYFDYSARQARREAELLISNVEIPPVEQIDVMTI